MLLNSIKQPEEIRLNGGKKIEMQLKDVQEITCDKIAIKVLDVDFH